MVVSGSDFETSKPLFWHNKLGVATNRTEPNLPWVWVWFELIPNRTWFDSFRTEPISNRINCELHIFRIEPESNHEPKLFFSSPSYTGSLYINFFLRYKIHMASFYRYEMSVFKLKNCSWKNTSQQIIEKNTASRRERRLGFKARGRVS
jgi:hypothetical protein